VLILFIKINSKKDLLMKILFSLESLFPFQGAGKEV
jgi:hypothetical protein